MVIMIWSILYTKSNVNMRQVFKCHKHTITGESFWVKSSCLYFWDMKAIGDVGHMHVCLYTEEKFMFDCGGYTLRCFFCWTRSSDVEWQRMTVFEPFVYWLHILAMNNHFIDLSFHLGLCVLGRGVLLLN